MCPTAAINLRGGVVSNAAHAISADFQRGIFREKTCSADPRLPLKRIQKDEPYSERHQKMPKYRDY